MITSSIEMQYFAKMWLVSSPSQKPLFTCYLYFPFFVSRHMDTHSLQRPPPPKKPLIVQIVFSNANNNVNSYSLL